MDVQSLIARVESQVPQGAQAGTRGQAEDLVKAGAFTHHVDVRMRIDPKGRRREIYLCDGTRVQRHELLRLTCPHSECPQASALRLFWNHFQSRRNGVVSVTSTRPSLFAQLVCELPVSVGGQHYVARRASFRCFTACPNGAHPPMWFERQGYDLFEEGMCVGGGVTTVDGQSRPRLPDLQAAHAYVRARQLEAQAVVAAVAERSTKE